MNYRRFIFLDIDGVLNHDEWYNHLYNTYPGEELSRWDVNKYHISPASTRLLNQLEGCEVVISSSWGYDETTVQGLRNAGLALPIIGGITHKSLLDKSLCRGNDIARWFVDNVSDMPPMDAVMHVGNGLACGESGHFDPWYHTKYHYNFVNGKEERVIEDGDVAYTYVIFDDDNDMLFQQQEHFIHVNSMVGITQSDIDKAKKILMLCG